MIPFKKQLVHTSKTEISSWLEELLSMGYVKPNPIRQTKFGKCSLVIEIGDTQKNPFQSNLLLIQNRIVLKILIIIPVMFTGNVLI